MRRLLGGIALALGFAALVPLPACIPDIDISSCLRGCGIDAGPCADAIESCVDDCGEDVDCATSCTELLADCVEDAGDELIDCAADCLAEAEDKL